MEERGKNTEATGRRASLYDNWRGSLDYTPVTFVEFRRHRGTDVMRDTHICDIKCIVYPHILERGQALGAGDVRALVAKDQHFVLRVYQSLASRLGVPCYCVVGDNMEDGRIKVDTFLVHDMQAAPDVVTLYEAERFAREVIDQAWANPSNPNTGEARDTPVGRYSSWHRIYLAGGAYLIDLDYVEYQARTPVAVIETTEAYGGDLVKGVFNFVSRGFMQQAAYLQIAGTLRIPYFIVVYLEDMSRLMVVKANDTLIRASDPLDRVRNALTKKYAPNLRRAHGPQEGWRRAQGQACDELYGMSLDTLTREMSSARWRGSAAAYFATLLGPAVSVPGEMSVRECFARVLATTTPEDMTVTKYREWLEGRQWVDSGGAQ